MPKSLLDWLSVVSLWVGALVFAIKSIGAPLLPGAPAFLAASFWNFVPLVLVSFALGVFVLRLIRPVSVPQLAAPASLVEEPPPYNEKRPGLSNTLLEIHEARRVARMAVADRRTSYAGPVAMMESALISTQRTFGIDTPEGEGAEREWLRLWLDYYDVVWPFLVNGNYEAAKARAVRFIVDRHLKIRAS